jgi:hypothetical protein
VSNPASFHAEAKFQVACGYCGKVGQPFHAHHVVDKSTLRDWGIPKPDRYDTRNAMRLCEGLDTDRCHFQFENSRIEISLSSLSDENIEYAFEAAPTPGKAYEYLTRHYAGDDDRVELKFREMEALAA